MDRVIEEENWNYVCFERGQNVFLTYLIQHGPVTLDYTVELNSEEKHLIKSGKFKAKQLLGGFDEARLLSPPIWPSK